MELKNKNFQFDTIFDFNPSPAGIGRRQNQTSCLIDVMISLQEIEPEIHSDENLKSIILVSLLFLFLNLS